MTSDARKKLVEKVARGLCADMCGPIACKPPLCEGCLDAASTAIDIALEEAAMVAEAKADGWATEWRQGLKSNSHLEGKSDGADDVAAAIRAMKGKPDDIEPIPLSQGGKT